MRKFCVMFGSVALLWGCTTSSGTDFDELEISATQCQDKKDNDKDGRVDCKDKDCQGFVFCAKDETDAGTIEDSESAEGDTGSESEAEPVPCENTADCADGDFCNLTLDPPVCQGPPIGQGEACSENADCADFEADYCESFVAMTCLKSGCSPELEDCSPGYHCCDFAWLGLPSICVDETLSGGVCSQGDCTSSDDCADGTYCDLTLDPPSCLPPPSGQGRACETAADCMGFRADYCENMVAGTCVMQGCDKDANNCSTGYQCCDLTWIGLPSLCIDDALSGGHCACSVDDDCREGEFCDTSLENPSCYPISTD